VVSGANAAGIDQQQPTDTERRELQCDLPADAAEAEYGHAAIGQRRSCPRTVSIRRLSGGLGLFHDTPCDVPRWLISGF